MRTRAGGIDVAEGTVTPPPPVAPRAGRVPRGRRPSRTARRRGPPSGLPRRAPSSSPRGWRHGPLPAQIPRRRRARRGRCRASVPRDRWPTRPPRTPAVMSSSRDSGAARPGTGRSGRRPRRGPRRQLGSRGEPGPGRWSRAPRARLRGLPPMPARPSAPRARRARRRRGAAWPGRSIANRRTTGRHRPRRRGARRRGRWRPVVRRLAIERPGQAAPRRRRARRARGALGRAGIGGSPRSRARGARDHRPGPGSPRDPSWRRGPRLGRRPERPIPGRAAPESREDDITAGVGGGRVGHRSRGTDARYRPRRARRRRGICAGRGPCRHPRGDEDGARRGSPEGGPRRRAVREGRRPRGTRPARGATGGGGVTVPSATSIPPARVRIYEVGPRDGLQNEATAVPTAAKVRFIELLVAAGLREIEATSFVRPDRIPQLADADEVLSSLPRGSGVRYPVLVANARGLARAADAGADAIAVFTAATDAFAERNIGLSIEASLGAFGPLLEEAARRGWWRRAASSRRGPPAPSDAALHTPMFRSA